MYIAIQLEWGSGWNVMSNHRFLISVLACLGLCAVQAKLSQAWCIGAPLGGNGLTIVEPVLDGDGDGLNNLQEAFLGTSDNDVDSDDDGIGDANEVQDGIRNLDRPTLYSVERFADPNDPENRQIIVLEGNNLFRGRRLAGAAWVNVVDTGRRRLVRRSLRGNSQNRIALRLPNTRAERLIGAAPSTFFIRTLGRQRTNDLTLQPMELDCEEPHIMGAALIRLRAEIDGAFETFEYIGIGGCGLVERVNSREVATTIVLTDHALPIDGEHRIRMRGPAQGVALIGSRILTPVRPRIIADGLNPLVADGEEIRVGDRVAIVRGNGAVGVDADTVVEGLIADLSIPESNLNADHDGDGISSAREIRDGTDPLIFDTDRDGLHDGIERRTDFDANDPDTDDDGILDGVEYVESIQTTPLRFWGPRVRQVQRRRLRPSRR